jgi:hypothetical protein
LYRPMILGMNTFIVGELYSSIFILLEKKVIFGMWIMIVL